MGHEISARMLLGDKVAARLPAPAPGFEPLFNGKDLEGWEGYEDLWSVKDGVLAWERWDPNGPSRDPVAVSYVWDANYGGIEFAKKNPGKLMNASSSNGSPGHVGGELFKDGGDPDRKDLITEQELDFEQPELRDFRCAGSEVHVTFLGGDTESNNALGVYTFDRKTGLMTAPVMKSQSSRMR